MARERIVRREGRRWKSGLLGSEPGEPNVADGGERDQKDQEEKD